MIDKQKLTEIEQVSRWLMAIILLTAGISKFFSHGGFKDYYSGLFGNEALRLNFPAITYDSYLMLIPFIEVGLGAALLVVTLKRYTIWIWYAFMASLLIGHYILQEFSAVNQMLIYFILGMICHILPIKAELSTKK